MKKIYMAVALLAFAALPAATLAQESKKEKADKAPKKETSEITIRQNGDKEIKMKVEIDGDNITVNGKPLSEFKDKDITINKRKVIIRDGNNSMSWNFSGDGEDWGHFGETFGNAFGNGFSHSWPEGNQSQGAFLGVTTEKEADGAKVVDLVKGSAAEKAGLKKGDIITRVEEEKITGPEALSDVIAFKKPTDEVKVTYKRNGKENTVKATLGKRSNSRVYSFNGPGGDARVFTMPPMAEPPLTNMEGLNEDLLELREHALQNALPFRKKIGLKIQDTEEGNGVKVINVEDSSAAENAGIRKDDIITEINGKKIENTDDAREELVPDAEKKSYKIKVNRGGTEMNFDVRIPKKLKTANL